MPPCLPLTEEEAPTGKGKMHPPSPARRGGLEERAGPSSLPFKRSSTTCSSKAAKAGERRVPKQTAGALEEEQSRLLLELTTNNTPDDSNNNHNKDNESRRRRGSNKKVAQRSSTVLLESKVGPGTVQHGQKTTPHMASESQGKQQQQPHGELQEQDDGTRRHFPPSGSLVSAPTSPDEEQEDWSMTVGDHTGFTETTDSSRPFHQEDDLAPAFPNRSSSIIATTTATPSKKKPKRLATFRKKLQSFFRRTPKETLSNTKKVGDNDSDLPQSPRPLSSKPSMVKRVASLSIIMGRRSSKVIVVPKREVFSKDNEDTATAAMPLEKGPRFRRATSLTVVPRHDQRYTDSSLRDPSFPHKPSSSMVSSPVVMVEYKAFSKNVPREDNTTTQGSDYQPVTPSFRRSASLNPRASSTSPTSGGSSVESSMVSPPKRTKSTTTKRQKQLRKASSLDPGAIERALRGTNKTELEPLSTLPKLKKKKSSKKKKKTQELRRSLSLNQVPDKRRQSNERQERMLPTSSFSAKLHASRQITRTASLNQLALDCKPKDEAPLIPQRYDSSMMMKKLDLLSVRPVPPIRVDSPPTPKRKNSKRLPSTKLVVAGRPESNVGSGGRKLRKHPSKKELKKGSSSVKRLPFEIEMDEDSEMDSDSDLEKEQGPSPKKAVPFQVEMDQEALLDVDFDASEMNDVVSPLVSLGGSKPKKRTSMSLVSKIQAPFVEVESSVTNTINLEQGRTFARMENDSVPEQNSTHSAPIAQLST